MTKLEELAERAKQAQREYDIAANEIEREALRSKISTVPEGTIIVTSDKDGITWQCNAEHDQIVAHALSTLKSAISALNKCETAGDTIMSKAALALGMFEIVKQLSEDS